jgi:hypothetical protein
MKMDEKQRQRRNILLGVAHALLALLVLGGYVYVQVHFR